MYGKRHLGSESGASLVGLLLAMALAGTLLAMGAEFFESNQKASGDEQAVLSLQREASRLHHLLEVQITDAGFGFPDSCGSAGVLSDWPNESAPVGSGTWYPISATASGGLAWITSANGVGNTAVTQIVNMPSMQSDSFTVQNVNNLHIGDGLAAEVPGMACFVSTIHSLSTSSGKEVTYVKIPRGSWGDLAQNAGVSVSAAEMTNARVYNLGQITASTLVLNGTDLQETLSGQETNFQAQTITLSSRVLGWYVQVATGSPIQWESAVQWNQQAQNGNAQPIEAVQIGVVLASRQSFASAHTPSTVNLQGQSISVPASFHGHMVQSFVWTFPVPNDLWSNRV